MSRRIRWLIASPMIALTMAIAACGGSRGPGASAPPSASAIPRVCTKSGPVMFAVSGRQDSPAPALTGTMQAAAITAVDSGSAIGLVNVDGKPQLVAASAFSDPSAGNGQPSQPTRRTTSGSSKSAVAGVRATAPHADVLDALDVAGRAVRAACSVGGTVYLADSGLSETGPVDFRQQGLLQAMPSDVVAFLSRVARVAAPEGHLRGARGIGDTAPPQQPLSIAQRDNLISIWSAIAKAGGASSVRVDPAPRGGAAPAGVPPVALVPVPAQPVWTPSDPTFPLPDSGPVGFEPNTAVFRDPAAAAAALKKIADYLIADPAAKIPSPAPPHTGRPGPARSPPTNPWDSAERWPARPFSSS